MTTRTHVGFWVATFFALFFLTPIMRNGPAMEAFVERELALTRQTFGETITGKLEAQAQLVYSLYTPAASLSDSIVKGKDMDLTRAITAEPGVAFTKRFNSYVQGLVLNLFVMVLRLFIFMIWLLVLFPIFVASVIDGFVQRAIKRAEFGAIRPAAYTVTSMVVVPLAMAPLVYLVLPLPVSPLVSPIWALALILPLSAMVSNMQPIFGRN